MYHQELESDDDAIQGGRTAEGIHDGVMGATIEVATGVYGGIDALGAVVSVAPALPKAWPELATVVHWRGIRFDFVIRPQTITVEASQDAPLVVAGVLHQLAAGEPQTIAYSRKEVI